MNRSLHIVALAVLSILFVSGTVLSAPTPAQKEQISQLSLAITKAGNLFKAGKFKESADVLKDVNSKVEKLGTDASKDLINLLNPICDKLERASALLELEGIELPAIKRPVEKAPAPAPAPVGAPSAVTVPTGPVSFVKHVAPILITRCGNCHVRNARGMISMATFESLIKGKPNVDMVVPMQPGASFMIGVIEDGEMPPNGSVPKPELDTLKKWITEGGKFDGKDEKENLSTLAPGAKADTGPKIELAVATGKEKLSFAKDIAPMLIESCYGCHGGGQRAQANFNLTTFNGILRGGESGAPVLPGKPADSLLVKKLKGTANGMRMPQRKEKWSDEMIAKIELWITEGAKFDGGNGNTDIERVAAVSKAQRSTHEQLTADRGKLAEEHWKRSSPGITASRSESVNFLTMGDVGANTLTDIGERAESLAPKIAGILKADPERPLLKGRFTLFVFGERYGYSEFGKMVERREIPREWRGHWMFDIVDAYGVVVPSRTNEYSLETVVAQQLAGAYVASLGKIPHWFAEGSGRVVAAKIDPTDSRVRNWNDAISAAIGDMKKADDFMSSNAASEGSDVCSYSFVSLLATDMKKYQRLLDDLRNGVDFDKAFASNYGGSPSQVADVWVKRPAVKSTAKPVTKGKK